MSQFVTGMLARGVVVLANASRKLQTLQLRLTAREAKDNVEHFEPYGFTSCPEDGAEALVAFLGGDRSHGVAFMVSDRRVRLQGLRPGEVAIFTGEGQALVLKNGKIAELTTGTFRVNAETAIELNAPKVTAQADIEAGGKLKAATDVEIAGKPVLHHRHPETGAITGEMQL
jgi:phage baseplate assembly protein V